MAATARKTAAAGARSAAAEAASEARAEAEANAALEKLNRARENAEGQAQWRDFLVDVWLTPFNSVEFGFWKRERNRGKSRQFTSDMDIFAEIVEDGERTGVLGYRKDLWNDQTGMDKRLVFKLFSETLSWHASMDLLVARSVQQTIGARGIPITTYSVNTHEDDFIIYLERSANKWPLMPEHFSFFVMVDDKPRFYRLRRNVINLGGDYTLISQDGEPVGYLDGAIVTIGGKWRGRVRGDHADPRVLQVMKLFAGMIVFNRLARRHIKALAHDIGAGRIETGIQRQEADLYMNPRRGH